MKPRRIAGGGGPPVAPSRGRGLKPADPPLDIGERGRPLTGARIETLLRPRGALLVGVAPSRGRGLKRG